MSKAVLEPAFDRIAAVMKDASSACSSALADAEAKKQGLIRLGDDGPKTRFDWERTVGDWSLRYQWRYYDQSQAFSIQKDMNVLTVWLLEGTKVVKTAEERFED